MQGKHAAKSKRSGDEQKRASEVPGRALQLTDDDRTDKPTAIADRVDQGKPGRGTSSGQDRGWQRPERADGGKNTERGKRQRQHDERSGPAWADQAKAAAD